MKLPVLRSTTGLSPAIAAPTARPQNPSSEIGGDTTRSGKVLAISWKAPRCGLKLKKDPPIR